MADQRSSTTTGTRGAESSDSGDGKAPCLPWSVAIAGSLERTVELDPMMTAEAPDGGANGRRVALGGWGGSFSTSADGPIELERLLLRFGGNGF